MKYESKGIELYHNLMMVCCALIVVGGCILSFAYGQEYHSYSFFSGGYYETNAVKIIVGLCITGLFTATYYAIAQVTSEFFNNVCIIANKAKADMINNSEKEVSGDTEQEKVVLEEEANVASAEKVMQEKD